MTAVQRWLPGIFLLAACSTVPSNNTSPSSASPPQPSGVSLPNPAQCVNGPGDASWPRTVTWKDDGQPVPLPMPPLEHVPSSLEGEVSRCREGFAHSCTLLGDALRQGFAPSPAMALYRRAAEIDYLALPTPPRRGLSPIRDAASALDAFQLQWFRDVTANLPQTANRNLLRELGPCMAGRLHYSVSLLPRREAFRRIHIEQTELGGAHTVPLLYGRIEDLAGPGELWHVYYGGSLPGHMIFGGFSGYLDPDSGQLLVAVSEKEG